VCAVRPSSGRVRHARAPRSGVGRSVDA
jgi:hypothetical protein